MVSLKRREILDRHRSLLENNLILTEQLMQWFRARRVFPDFLLDEIQVKHFLVSFDAKNFDFSSSR